MLERCITRVATLYNTCFIGQHTTGDHLKTVNITTYISMMALGPVIEVQPHAHPRNISKITEYMVGLLTRMNLDNILRYLFPELLFATE